MPSPGGQVSGMASHENYCGRAGWAGCGSPSTSQRATTRQPGGRAGQCTRRFRRGLPPGCRVVGRRQVDGTPHEPQRARSFAMFRQRKALRSPATPPHGRKYSVIAWEGMSRNPGRWVMAGCLDRLGLFRGGGYGEDPGGVPVSGWMVLGGSSSRLRGVSSGSGSQGRNR